MYRIYTRCCMLYSTWHGYSPTAAGALTIILPIKHYFSVSLLPFELLHKLPTTPLRPSTRLAPTHSRHSRHPRATLHLRSDRQQPSRISTMLNPTAKTFEPTARISPLVEDRDVPSETIALRTLNGNLIYLDVEADPYGDLAGEAVRNSAPITAHTTQTASIRSRKTATPAPSTRLLKPQAVRPMRWFTTEDGARVCSSIQAQTREDGKTEIERFEWHGPSLRPYGRFSKLRKERVNAKSHVSYSETTHTTLSHS